VDVKLAKLGEVRWENAPELLTPQEAAVLLRVGISTAYKLISVDKTIPSLRVGRKILVSRDVLKAHVNAYTQTQTGIEN
jgi:excisionase family DNA binding protein